MRKKWYVLFVLILFVMQGALLTAVDNPPKPVTKLIEKAEKAFKKNEIDKAMESYNQALALAPEYGPIYLGIARIQSSQKKYDEAVVNLEKALQFDPESTTVKQFFANTLFNAGREASTQRDLNKANDYFTKLIGIPGISSQEPKYYLETLFQIGNNYSMLEKFAQANDYFKKLVEIPEIAIADPGLVLHVYYKMGINANQAQKFADSNTYLEKLLGFPNAQTNNSKVFTICHYMVGLNSSQLKEYAKSEEYLNKFIELNKVEANNNPQLEPLAHFILGSNLMTVLDEEVQKIRDDANEKREKKKDIQELAGKSPQIETYLSKAIELQPELEPAYMQLGNYYYYLGNIPKTIEYYKSLIEKFPTSQDIGAYKQFLTDLEKPVEVAKPEAKADAKKKKK